SGSRKAVRPDWPGAEGLRGGHPVEAAVPVGRPGLRVPADRLAVDQDLRNRPAAGELVELLAEGRIVVEVELLVRQPLRVEQRLGADAVAAPARRIHLNSGHYWFKRRRRRNRSRLGRL